MSLFSSIGSLYLLWVWMGAVPLLWPPPPVRDASFSPHPGVRWLTVAAAPRQSSPAGDDPLLAITARVTLDSGWQFPLVNVRAPVTYRLHIERDAHVLVLPESVTPEALRRMLVRSTALLPELFDIMQTSQKTEALSHERWRDTVEFTLRFSKPGAYSIPALPIAYSLEKSPRTSHTLQSAPLQGFVLTVDAHLPIGAGALPGDILAPSPLAQYAWPWLRYVAFGLLTGGMLALVSSLLLRVSQGRPPRRYKQLSKRQLRQKYQTELQQLRQQTPTIDGALSPEIRTWLRDSAALVRHLLGELTTGDAALFTGGAGASAAMVLAHLQLASPGQEARFQTALRLIEELDVLATAPTAVLTVEDSQRFSDALQSIILQLTHSEGSRVLRITTRL